MSQPLDNILIAIFCGTVFIIVRERIRSGDDLFAVLLSCLFIYTIFTQIAYVNYPEIPAAAKVYFGPEVFKEYWVFVFLSFVATAALRWLIAHKDGTDSRSTVGIRLPSLAFVTVAALYLVSLAVAFAVFYSDIRYANVSNSWVGYLINIQPVVILALFIKARTSPPNVSGVVTRALGVSAFILFIVVSFRTGQRLAALSLLVGIAFFELSPFSRMRKKTPRLLGLLTGVIVFLFVADKVVEQRNEFSGETPIGAIWTAITSTGSDSNLSPERILQLDYFAPSSLIFVSLYHDLVIPGEVLRSNVANALVFIGYPYLSNTFAEFVSPSAYSRNESYGYYIMTEGFNAVGWWGIVYNAIVINAGTKLWELFTKSRNAEFNRSMKAMLALLMIGLVRAQSALFFRNTYLLIFPAVILIALAHENWPRWLRSRQVIVAVPRKTWNDPQGSRPLA